MYRSLSYAQFLKANSLDPQNIPSEMSAMANQYALNESLKATYRDANALADVVAGAVVARGVGAHYIVAITIYVEVHPALDAVDEKVEVKMLHLVFEVDDGLFQVGAVWVGDGLAIH